MQHADINLLVLRELACSCQRAVAAVAWPHKADQNVLQCAATFLNRSLIEDVSKHEFHQSNKDRGRDRELGQGMLGSTGHRVGVQGWEEHACLV